MQHQGEEQQGIRTWLQEEGGGPGLLHHHSERVRALICSNSSGPSLSQGSAVREQSATDPRKGLLKACGVSLAQASETWSQV